MFEKCEDRVDNQCGRKWCQSFWMYGLFESEIKAVLKLEPMENVYEYVKAVQGQFDDSKIKFSNEYYDTLVQPTLINFMLYLSLPLALFF